MGTSEASGDRDAFERVESVEELETATLTDVETKKVGNQAGGIKAVRELLTAEKKPKYELEHAESSPKAEGDAEKATLEEESRQKAEAEEAKAKAEAEAAMAKLEEEARLKSEAEAAKAK